MSKVRVYVRGDRGFHGYGRPLRDTYGGEIEVYESSNADGPRVWLRVEDRAWNRSTAPGESFAHLNKKQAKSLIDRLQTWMDEIPKRWGKR